MADRDDLVCILNVTPDRIEVLLSQRAWLRALATQLVGCADAAEELADDALATAVSGAAPRRAGPRAWLAAILRHQVAGRRRAERRRRDREARAARAEAQPSAADTVARLEVQRDVADAVLALPEPYRTAVLLRFWDELSPSAIARRLDVPVETVRTRLKRALQQLRERLDRAHGGDRRAWALPLLGAPRPHGATVPSLTGALLMHFVSKSMTAVLVLAAALLLAVTIPLWSGGEAPRPRAPSPASPAVGASSPAGAAETEHAGAARVPASDGEGVHASAAWLTVTGEVVDDAMGAPVPGCEIRLSGWTTAVEADPVATTDPDGRFTVRDARPLGANGRCIVASAHDRAPARVTVPCKSEPRELQRVDLGTIRLVAGTRFSGRVVTADGAPVAGADLWLPQAATFYGGPGPEDMLEHVVAVGRSGADGTFTVGQRIAPDAGHRNLLFASSPQGIGWSTFEASRQRRDVGDLVIPLRPSGALRVAVSDEAGRPVAGAGILALPRFSPIGIERAGMRSEVSHEPALRVRFEGTTDELGVVLLAGLPIGQVPSWRIGEAYGGAYELLISAAGHGEPRFVKCELRPDAESVVEVRLPGARDVAVDIEVRDERGVPVQDASVRVAAEEAASARTDAHGRARVVVRGISGATVSASSPGHRSAEERLVLEPGALAVRVDLTLPRVRRFAGRVVDQHGAPAQGMSVFVDHRRLAVTDERGAFEIDEFPAGPRRVVIAVGAGDARAWTGSQTPETVDVETVDGPVTFVMERRTGRVDLRAAVVDAATGQPLELADVGLWMFEPSIERFAVRVPAQHRRGVVTADGLAAGRWRLDVRAVSGHRGSRELTLIEGQPPVDLRLELPAPGAVTGRLSFEGVSPPPTVRVTASFAKVDPAAFTSMHYPGRWQPSPGQVLPDRTGRTLELQPALDPTFHLASVDPTEDVVLQVSGDGVTGRAQLRVGPGETRRIVLEVRARER